MSAGISGLIANTCSLLVNAVAKLFVNGNGAIATADGNYGDAGQVLKSAGDAAQAEWGSAVNNSAAVTASGTAVDFTNIPSWAKRLTFMFTSLSTTGTSGVVLRLGTSSGFVTSGYVGFAETTSVTSGIPTHSAGSTAANNYSGITTLIRVGNTNQWVATSQAYSSGGSSVNAESMVTLPDVCTQLRLTTTGGTDTFDAGTVSISWE